LRDLEERISHLESMTEERYPIIASAMVKLESVNLALQDNGILTSEEIDNGVNKIMKEIK